jgi:hypothetical protein
MGVAERKRGRTLNYPRRREVAEKKREMRELIFHLGPGDAALPPPRSSEYTELRPQTFFPQKIIVSTRGHARTRVSDTVGVSMHGRAWTRVDVSTLCFPSEITPVCFFVLRICLNM